MAKQTINNGESGSSIRTKLNAMFTELYSHVTSATSWFLLLFNPSAKVAFPGSGILQPTQNGRVYDNKLYTGTLALSVADCAYNDSCNGILIGDTEPTISNAWLHGNSDPFVAGDIMQFWVLKTAYGFIYWYQDLGPSESSDIPESSDVVIESSDVILPESSDFILESSDVIPESSDVIPDAPTLSGSPSIDSTGYILSIPFSRAMANPAGLGQYVITNPNKTYILALKSGDATIIEATANTPHVTGDVTLTITAGHLLPADGGDAFAGVTGTSVTNNVLASEQNITGATYSNNFGNGGSGTVYTVGPSVGFGYFISDQVFSGDFETIIDMTDTYFQSGYNLWVGLALSSDTTASGYTTWLLSFSTQSNTSLLVINGSVNADTHIFAQGDRLKLKRVGSTITLQKYNLGSWTTLYTYTATSSASLRFRAQAYGDGTFRNKLYNPKYL